MIGSLIGAGVSAVGSIFGGIKASQAMKKAKRDIEARKERNEAWYERRMNEDATQRADAQRVLNRTEEAMRNRSKAAAGTAAVMGGTEEGAAATKAAGAQAMADAAAQIAAQGENRKDMVEQQYLQRDAQLDEELNNIEVNKANSIAQAVQGVTEAGASIASADWTKPTEPTEPTEPKEAEDD